MEPCVNDSIQLITQGDMSMSKTTYHYIELDIGCEFVNHFNTFETVEEIEAKANDVPVTQFPGWVRPDYVRQIRGLHCFEDVREMIILGVPVVEVARKVHSLGELKNLKINTLEMQLRHYKATIPKWLIAARQSENLPVQYLEVKKASEAIEVFTELTSLYEMIKERLQIGMRVDRKFEIVTPHLEKTFMVAAGILDKIREMKERNWVAQEDQRVVNAPTKSLDWSKIYSSGSVAKVMADPESRSRVIKVAERLMDLYGKNLTLEQIDRLQKAKEVSD